MSEVFISYSWDSIEHKETVISFTNFLRARGYDANIDRLLSQTETSKDFFVMMYKEIVNHNKVIVVLSKGYKHKADLFKGGVGKEYELILKDIAEHPQKYILISFEGINDEIVPLGFRGREIVDLSYTDNIEILDYKLTDTPLYDFAEVAPQKPQVTPKKIKPFVIGDTNTSSFTDRNSWKNELENDAKKLLHLDKKIAPPSKSKWVDNKFIKSFDQELENAFSEAKIQAGVLKEPPTIEEIKLIFESFRTQLLAENRFNLNTQCSLMKITFTKPDEIRLISSSELTNMYAKEIRNELVDLYKMRLKMYVRIITEIDETLH